MKFIGFLEPVLSTGNTASSVYCFCDVEMELCLVIPPPVTRQHFLTSNHARTTSSGSLLPPIHGCALALMDFTNLLCLVLPCEYLVIKVSPTFLTQNFDDLLSLRLSIQPRDNRCIPVPGADVSVVYRSYSHALYGLLLYPFNSVDFLSHPRVATLSGSIAI